VAAIPEVHLTLIGEGENHEALKHLIKIKKIENRVILIPRLENNQLCQQLPEFDFFVVHSEYWEISKSVLEAMLTGLPIIINRRRGEPVPELTGEIVCLVDPDAGAYEKAIRHLSAQVARREKLGRAAYEFAHANWGPNITETRFADIYRKLLSWPKGAAGK